MNFFNIYLRSLKERFDLFEVCEPAVEEVVGEWLKDGDDRVAIVAEVLYEYS